MAAILCFIAGGGFLIWCLYYIFARFLPAPSPKKATTVEVEAVVRQVLPRRRLSTRLCQPLYEYSLDGQTYCQTGQPVGENLYQNNMTSFRLGETRSLLVNSRSPLHLLEDPADLQKMALNVAVLATCALSFIGYGFFLYLRLPA